VRLYLLPHQQIFVRVERHLLVHWVIQNLRSRLNPALLLVLLLLFQLLTLSGAKPTKSRRLTEALESRPVWLLALKSTKRNVEFFFHIVVYEVFWQSLIAFLQIKIHLPFIQHSSSPLLLRRISKHLSFAHAFALHCLVALGPGPPIVGLSVAYLSLINLFSQVVKDSLQVKLRLLQDLGDEDGARLGYLLLAVFEILSVFGVKQLRIATFDLFVVLEEALVVDQVFKRFPDFFKVDGLVVLDLSIDLALRLQHVVLEQLHPVDVPLARCPCRPLRTGGPIRKLIVLPLGVLDGCVVVGHLRFVVGGEASVRVAILALVASLLGERTGPRLRAQRPRQTWVIARLLADEQARGVGGGPLRENAVNVESIQAQLFFYQQNRFVAHLLQRCSKVLGELGHEAVDFENVVVRDKEVAL